MDNGNIAVMIMNIYIQFSTLAMMTDLTYCSESKMRRLTLAMLVPVTIWS